MEIQTLLEYVRSVNLTQILSLDDDVSIEFLAQGEYNKNYLLFDSNRTFVLRVNYGSQIDTENQILYEANTLMALENTGVTPHCYYVDGSFEHIPQGVLVMEYLKGRPLDYATDLKKAAHIFASIHSAEIDQDRLSRHIFEEHVFSDRIKEADILLKNVWDSKYIDIGIKRIMEKVVSYAEQHVKDEEYFKREPLWCINNTEVNSNNFIIGTQEHRNEGSAYLLDWEKAVLTDPCQDLTHFIIPTTTLWKTDIVLSKEDEQLFFDTYKASRTLGEHDSIEARIKMYYPYMGLRAIAWCLFAYVEYQNPDKEIKNEDTYKKMQQYLEVDFLKTLFAGVC